jgi:hypothetical protein
METVGDTTDPQGTLRPNLPPEPTTGTYFETLPHPDFTYQINLPSSVDPVRPVEIWDLFFPEDVMNTLVQNTNKSGLYWAKIGPRNRRALEWQDVTVTEIYLYFVVLIYIGLHIENQIEQYWSQNRTSMPQHIPVQKAIACDCFKQVHTAFHISVQGQTVFEKVRKSSIL